MKKLLYRASKKTPYIGFVIEPYSLFLFFKLKDIEYAKSMLPDRYELTKTKLFADDEPDHYMGIGNLNTRASTFWGMRQESYLIATDKETGILSFIFIDILSNTIIALPSEGMVLGSARFTKSGFLGLAELGESVHAAYRDGDSGQEYRAFVILVDDEAQADALWTTLVKTWTEADLDGAPALYREVPYSGLVGLAGGPTGMVGVADCADENQVIDRLRFLRSR